MTVAAFVDRLPDGIQSLLAEDPGAAGGWAFFKKRYILAQGARVWELASCGIVHPLKGERPVVQSADLVLVEVPQWQHGDTAGRTNDLYKTAFRAGLLAEASRAGYCWCVSPHQWKGSVSKKLHHPRILKRLAAPELLTLDGATQANGKLVAQNELHNVIDAIGLGIWGVGRW